MAAGLCVMKMGRRITQRAVGGSRSDVSCRVKLSGVREEVGSVTAAHVAVLPAVHLL